MAAIDLSRFHQTFFEESFEGVETMERLLLGLDLTSSNEESINSIFRAAHSIKGGAGTFGFTDVAGFTHHLETLLDKLRSGGLAVDAGIVDLLLRANDVVHDLLNAARDHKAFDADNVRLVEAELRQLVDGPARAAAAAVAASAPTSDAVEGYKIEFIPAREIFSSGNDPLRILAQLASLGTVQVACASDPLPALRELDPASCYVSWRVELHTQAPQSEVRELFAWVEDECRLEIEPILAKATGTPPRVETPAALAPTAVAADAAQASQLATLPVTELRRGAERAAQPEAASIRVGTDKIDALLNLVGEIVITQSMLTQAARTLDPMKHETMLSGLQTLEAHTRRLQEAVMSTRMVPIETVFRRFPRMLRDLSQRLGKDVRLHTVGEGTELDKNVIEKISDPLTHLVRNSIDHGIELPAERQADGKPPQGQLTLRAGQQGGQIVIEIIDDGRGLDRDRILAKARAKNLRVSEAPTDSEVWQLIFQPGFSTAEQVTELSGRGVGMDVVKRNIESLGGQVELWSAPRRGTRVTVRLPLTLAILDGMLAAVGKETFVIPLSSVVESLRPEPGVVKPVLGNGKVVQVHEEFIPLIALHEIYGVADAETKPEKAIAIVLEGEGRKIALQVDDLLGQQQVVIKSLESNYHRIRGISGATILGDGHVALILDAGELVRTTYMATAA
jgi:two-component system chemotaxis sensor kinase CheA